ncbi:MAG: Eisosome assembly protein [Ramalina farinacea]|uniref:Eisosome assembly protein n=1 Tax=Ramalina farinacea TaxID=258253 RepID=A0AA43TTQ3_9LECA|nr:Eisosome assembly protein [Ramalina farinacea]
MGPSKPGAKLEDQAATAALYATRPKGDKSGKSDDYPLDADGKLSSASAATSLKHASPHDLPAYPIVGLQNTGASAGTAATLANANQKPIELWKPGNIPAANKAATLAKDYKPDPLWQPELSAAGSKAALYADRKGADVKIWRPTGTDAGHSAAGQAMRMKGLSPQLDDGHTVEGGRRALTAATGAMSSSRNRSGSTPTPVSSYPDASNSAANALKAATTAGRTPKKTQPTPTTSPGLSIDAAKIHNQALTNLSREMYTSHPPVAPETEEKKRQDTLRAAAVSMAKKMYDVQQRQAQEAATLRRSDSQYAANSAADRPQSSASSAETGPPQYANLQEAAKKLATERLAKLHDEHAAYRNYYGTQKPQNRKLSIRGRRRASSDGQAGDSDEERSKQIRSEMSLFTDKLAQVDGKKRKQDRDSLLAAAQRNVRASMTAQDARVFNDTGKVSPAMMAEWEAKARAKAESESEARLVNHGMVNIGGGKFLDQSEVDAIATAKVQPTLDEITDTAERHRERDEELRQQQLERERIAAEKVADDKERAAKTKEEWKRFRDEEKREERARKEEAKAKKAEEKRHRDEEKPSTEEPLGGKEPETVGTKPSTGDEEKLDPTSLSSPELGAKREPAKSTEEGENQPLAVSSAEEIARRVFAAPVKGETAVSDTEALGGEAQGLANATSNTADAPVVGAEKEEAPLQGASSTPSPISDPKHSTTKSQPSASVATRIALPAAAVAPSTETTVSGPSTPKSPKSKDSSKVSTWLKTKLSRRTSKATPVPASSAAGETAGEKMHISEPKDPKVFVGGANLGDDTTKTSSEQGDSSMREVALAGTEAGPVDAPAALPVSPASPNEPTVSRALGDHENDEDDESTSISSLSSDEDTRGRSAIRLADTLPQNDQPIFGSTAATHDRQANNATAATSQPKESLENPSLDTDSSAQREPSSTGAETEDFEEARDTFESQKLAPPEKGVLGGQGRKSDSPARDSKFVEEL